MIKAEHHSRETRLKRANAVKTAWVFGIIAVTIFATFIGAAVFRA